MFNCFFKVIIIISKPLIVGDKLDAHGTTTTTTTTTTTIRLLLVLLLLLLLLV